MVQTSKWVYNLLFNTRRSCGDHNILSYLLLCKGKITVQWVKQFLKLLVSNNEWLNSYSSILNCITNSNPTINKIIFKFIIMK